MFEVSSKYAYLYHDLGLSELRVLGVLNTVSSLCDRESERSESTHRTDYCSLQAVS